MTAALTISQPDTGSTDPLEDRDLVHLRRLLLNEDRRDIAAIRAELFRLDKRLGTDERFCRAVADQLVAALKVAEVENHRGLAGVMAPLVVSGIRREIVESRDVMVEALYPITGRLVAAAVGAAMKQLSDDINRKLEASLSPRQVQLRVKALITRQPLSDLVLAETTRGRLERLILIDRASGAVLAATDADGKSEPEPDNALNLLGGLVSAIVQFAGHALADTQGELRQLDFGGQIVLLRASPLFILAAITAAGTPNVRLPGAVDEAFLGFLEHVQTNKSQGEAAALSDLHETVAEKSAPTSKKKIVSPLKVAGALLVAGVAYFAWQAWATAHRYHQEDTDLAAIEQMPVFGNYPLDLSFDRGNQTILARGVLPTRAEADILRERIAVTFPTWRLAPRVAIVSETPLAMTTSARTADLEKALAAAMARLTEVEAADRRDAMLAKNETDTLAARLDRQDGHAADLGSAIAATTKQMTDLQRQTARSAKANEDTRQSADALATRLDTPLVRLEAAIRGTAVFFDAGAAYHDPDNASRDLGLLATALKATPDTRLRVIGYGDGLGTAKGNLEAARLRAAHVVADLKTMGVDPKQLKVVSTRPPDPIADDPTNGGNRRVVFERAFASE